MLYSILFILLVLAVIASIPAWPYSRTWGYFPTGILTVIALVMLVLALGGWNRGGPVVVP